MPRLPQEIWQRRIDSECAEVSRKGIKFDISPDRTRYTFYLDAPALCKRGNEIIPANSHKISLVLTRDYPYAGGFELVWLTPIFHPNIDEHGRVCIALVNKWAAGQTVASIIDALFQLLANPNPDSPLNFEAAQYYLENPGGNAPSGYRLSRPRIMG